MSHAVRNGDATVRIRLGEDAALSAGDLPRRLEDRKRIFRAGGGRILEEPRPEPLLHAAAAEDDIVVSVAVVVERDKARLEPHFYERPRVRIVIEKRRVIVAFLNAIRNGRRHKCNGDKRP